MSDSCVTETRQSPVLLSAQAYLQVVLLHQSWHDAGIQAVLWVQDFWHCVLTTISYTPRNPDSGRTQPVLQRQRKVDEEYACCSSSQQTQYFSTWTLEQSEQAMS
jgi:hypothetical protein